MTTNQSGYATGAAHDEQVIRRRNVADQAGVNGSIAPSAQEPDDKKLRKVRLGSKCIHVR